jgi:dihydrofolate reductase
MQVVLYNAISVDGFIAGEGDDSSWVDPVDWEEFARFIKESGIVVMGSNTYIASGDDFPYASAVNIVCTTNPALHKKSKEDVLFTSMKPKDVVEFAKDKKFEQLLLIGGGLMNGSFLNENLIDELVLSVHPLVLSKGIKLFEGTDKNPKLKLLSRKDMSNDLVQLRYRIL